MSDQQILDHTQDFSGTEQHRLTALFPPPDYVKQADAAQTHGDPAVLPLVVYAHPEGRLYPVHTKSATWMSALFFQEHGNELPWHIGTVVRERLKKAATFWGIESDVDRLWDTMSKSASLSEDALPDSVFALVWNDDGGTKTRRYPLRNAAEVVKAAEWFDAYRTDFRYSDRRTIAGNIMRRASELNVAIDCPSVEKSAGFGYCTADDVQNAWEHRDRLSRSRYPDLAGQARRLASSDAGDVVMNAELRHKIAEHMDEFDAATKLTSYYAQGFRVPEDYLFGITEGTVRNFAKQHVMLPNGVVYEKSALARIPANRITELLGSDLARQLTFEGVLSDAEKMAAATSSISAADAVKLMKLAEEFGVEPIGDVQIGPTLSDEEIAELAARRHSRSSAV